MGNVNAENLQTQDQVKIKNLIVSELGADSLSQRTRPGDGQHSIKGDRSARELTVYGRQEGAAKGYNPHKRGALSLSPPLAFCTATNESVQAWLCMGGAWRGLPHHKAHLLFKDRQPPLSDTRLLIEVVDPGQPARELFLIQPLELILFRPTPRAGQGWGEGE